MTEKNKELLLKDLCDRLLYNVKLKIGEHSDYTLYGILPHEDKQVIVMLVENDKKYPIEVYLHHIKPYLRPMSSMTEEEKLELVTLYLARDKRCRKDLRIKETEFFLNSCWYVQIVYKDENDKEVISAVYIGRCSYIEEIDWLNAHHFDYRGLIEKGIALEAPDGMYTVLCRNVNTKTDIRAKTPFFDKNGFRIYDGDVFVYLKYTNFKDGVPLDLIENYSKYENEVVLHPVFWDDDKKLWCSDVYGDCDNLASYDFNEVVVVTNINEHPELYNH